jgi:small conductance mechanosensitive channel
VYAFMPVLAQQQQQQPVLPDTDVIQQQTAWLVKVKDQSIVFLQTQGLEFLWGLITALVIFFVGKWATRIATRVVGRLLERAKVDPMLVRFASNIVYAVLLTFVVIAALSELGVQTTSLAAVMAAAGFAVGMALQGSLGNFASGVMMIVFRPFDLGHFVEAGGTTGIVEEIQIFHTVLRTPDNRRVIVPNGSITSSVITNYSANPTRRIDLVVGCGYGDDIRAVKSYLESVIAADERILADPEPLVAVSDLGESSVNFIVRPWVKADDYFTTKCDLTETIKLGFDERGFNIPFPSRDVYMHQAG